MIDVLFTICFTCIVVNESCIKVIVTRPSIDTMLQL